MSGTSFAAPADGGRDGAAAGRRRDAVLVAGGLPGHPDGVRRPQRRGRHVVARRRRPASTRRDGAGAVDAEAGVRIAQQRRWRDAPATRRGWDVGTLVVERLRAGPAGDVPLPRHRAEPGLFFPTVKVALAWDSAVTSSRRYPLASTLTVDLDLIVRDSRGVAGRVGRVVGQQLRGRRVRRDAGRDLRHHHPPLVGHRQRLVRRRLDGHRLFLGRCLIPVRPSQHRPGALDRRFPPWCPELKKDDVGFFCGASVINCC